MANQFNTASHLRPLTSTTHPFQVTFYYDTYPEAPELDINISYNKSARTRLGTTPLSAEQDAAVADGVLKGTIIGIPVWAYVHSGATIRAAYSNPFNCPWDSGRSGWAYLTVAEWRQVFNVKRMSKRLRARALEIIERDVAEYDHYLTGNCYGWVMRDTRTNETVDSCWGYYGESQLHLDARSALTQMENITPMQMPLQFSSTQGE
jgi:hypothetical protein